MKPGRGFRLLEAGRREGRGCVVDNDCAPLVSCCYQAGVAFVIAGCTPFGDGGIVVELQVPGGEPAQAFVLVEFHEPGFIQERCDLVPWGLVKEQVVALGDDQAYFRRDGDGPSDRVVDLAAEDRREDLPRGLRAQLAEQRDVADAVESVRSALAVLQPAGLEQRLRQVISVHGDQGDLPGMVGEQMLQALSVAHGQGIIHRDLKPRNIFIAQDPTGREYSKLLDFGLSKSLDVDSLTMSTTTGIGTPAYMAPEQADERLGKVGAHTDVWAMGVVLFEMATGRLPFMAESPIATLYQICHGEAADLRQLRPDAPDEFIEVVATALTRDTEERWSSVDEMRTALATIFGHLSESSKSSRMLVSSPTNNGVSTPTPLADVALDEQRAALLDTVLETPRPGEVKAVVVPAGAADTPAPASSKRPLLLIGGVAIAGAAAAAMLLLGGPDDHEAKPSSVPAAAQPSPAIADEKLVEPPVSMDAGAPSPVVTDETEPDDAPSPEQRIDVANDDDNCVFDANPDQADQDGDFDDWIELYNNGSSPIDLEGYYLSDDPEDVMQWAFPAGTEIAANGYLVVWADEDEDQSGLHANFKFVCKGKHFF